ncbi:MAG: DUF389 domain-containing protein [Solirubrobacterales bacterium]|nr:DUF389 domain-containing protein [Solirubrobacterales bacterium]
MNGSSERKLWHRVIVGETRTPDEIREAVYLFVGDVPAKQSRFWLLLLLATGIATAGVVADSTATVIGAMIIAPLAVPIQGVAAAIAFGELRALLISAGTLLAAIAVTIALAVGLGWALPELTPLDANSQVTGRVSPTLVDLVAAALTGLAGSFAIARRDVGDILPGVAIAISLVPPLSVVGVTVVAGDWDGAFGALLLFVTNMLAIIVVGAAVFSGLRARIPDVSVRALRHAYAVVALASLVVVAGLAVTTYRAVELSNWQTAAKEVGDKWASDNDERLIATRFRGSKLVFLVEGMTDGSQDKQLPRLLDGVVPEGTPIVVNRVAGRTTEVGDVPD